jgi:hypothetical protein
MDNEICHAHVFRCLVYVLDTLLQDGKKIPKWNPWARLCLFLGFSHLHPSLVPLLLNIEMGHISPQSHVMFDNKFNTVKNSLAVNQPSNGLVSFGWGMNISLMLIMMKTTDQSCLRCWTQSSHTPRQWQTNQLLNQFNQ